MCRYELFEQFTHFLWHKIGTLTYYNFFKENYLEKPFSRVVVTRSFFVKRQLSSTTKI